MLLSTGRPFFPDFVIGVNGRKTELGVLLADPKYAFETSDELPKTYAKHQAYGRVLIISQKGTAQWMTVRYNEKQNRAELGEPFRVVDTPGW